MCVSKIIIKAYMDYCLLYDCLNEPIPIQNKIITIIEYRILSVVAL